MGRQVETVMTFDKAHKRLVGAMVAAYIKHHPGARAKVVHQGHATWIEEDPNSGPEWTPEQLHKMHDLAEEYEAITRLPPEKAVLLWEAKAGDIELWFEEKTDTLGSRPPPA